MCPWVRTTALTSARLLPIAARLLSSSCLYPGSPASISVTPVEPPSTAYQFTNRVPARHTPGATSVGVMPANLASDVLRDVRVPDQEDGVVGSDRGDLAVWGAAAHAAEEDADLRLPSLEVRAEDVHLRVVGQLARAERLDPAAEPQSPLACDPQVAHPLGDAARRDEVAAAVERQQVDRGRAPFAARSAADLEDARAPDAHSAAGRDGDEAVEDVAREPAWNDVAVRCRLGHDGILSWEPASGGTDFFGETDSAGRSADAHWTGASRPVDRPGDRRRPRRRSRRRGDDHVRRPPRCRARPSPVSHCYQPRGRPQPFAVADADASQRVAEAHPDAVSDATGC